MSASFALGSYRRGTNAKDVATQVRGSSAPIASRLVSGEAMASGNGANPAFGHYYQNAMTPGLALALSEHASSSPFFPKIKANGGQRAVSARKASGAKSLLCNDEKDAKEDEKQCRGKEAANDARAGDSIVLSRDTYAAPCAGKEIQPQSRDLSACSGAKIFETVEDLEALSTRLYKPAASVKTPPTAQSLRTTASPLIIEPGKVDDELIREAVENVVEKQVAAALGPLRLITSDLKLILANNLNQNSDLDQQNEILSRQLDLQYRDIQRTADVFHGQSKALVTLIETMGNSNHNVTEQMATAKSLAKDLTEMISSLATNIDQVSSATSSATATMTSSAVATTMAIEVRSALEQVMAAQEQSMRNIDAYLEQQCAMINQYRDHVTHEIASFERGHQQQLDPATMQMDDNCNCYNRKFDKAEPSRGWFRSIGRMFHR